MKATIMVGWLIGWLSFYLKWNTMKIYAQLTKKNRKCSGRERKIVLEMERYWIK